MTEWQVRRLGEICEFKPSKRQARSALSDQDHVSFVPMSDLGIQQKQVVATEDRPLGEVVGSYTYFADGDVLLAKITPCFENGKLGIARDLTNGVGFGSSEFMVIRPGPSVLADYVYYFLNRDSFRTVAARAMTGAVGHKRIPQDLVESLEIPLPSIEDQKRIIALLDDSFASVTMVMANLERQLGLAASLKQSLLARAFAGEMIGHKRQTA